MATDNSNHLDATSNNLPKASQVESARNQALENAVDALFGHKEHYLPPGVSIPIQGFDFNQWKGTGEDYSRLLASYATTGFQATYVAQAIDTINAMLAAKYNLPNEKSKFSQNGNGTPNGNHISDGKAEDENEFSNKKDSINPIGRPITGCTIFFAFTSNCITSGLRDIVRFLAEHNMVDVIVSTAGGIEEDLMKCFASTYLGDFYKWTGAELRTRGVNRAGNLLIPNANYCAFEDWIKPILDKMLEEQKAGTKWTPSRFIARLGKEINNPSSYLYWAAKNNIPVFSPALTDGSIGDMLHFHSFKNSPGLSLDIVADVHLIDQQAMYAKRSGIIVLGGGLVKHHVCNANMMRNGANWSVYVNTALELDGSDAGARPDEAVSWGKIRPDADAVKVFGDMTTIFPLIVAETFAKMRNRLIDTEKPSKATSDNDE